MSVCAKCKKPVTWVYTESGKKMPLDPLPVKDGNVVYAGDGPDRVRVLKKADYDDLFLAGLQRYKSHFATCSHPDSFRNNPPRRKG